MKKGDMILAGVVAACAVAAAAFWLMPSSHAATLEIYHQNERIATLPLNEDTQYPIRLNGNENIVEIKDGKAFMVSANCRDHICVNSPAISHDGETIVCLPHGIVLKTTGGDGPSLDALVQ